MHLTIATDTRGKVLDYVIIATGVVITIVTTAITLVTWNDASS